MKICKKLLAISLFLTIPAMSNGNYANSEDYNISTDIINSVKIITGYDFFEHLLKYPNLTNATRFIKYNITSNIILAAIGYSYYQKLEQKNKELQDQIDKINQKSEDQQA